MSKPDIFQALADPTRRVILEWLQQRGELPAGEIAMLFSEISRPAVSRHLRVLREAGLLSVRKDGREQYYAIVPATLQASIIAWLEQFGPLWDQSLGALKELVEDGSQG